jgi:hypothetical protein
MSKDEQKFLETYRQLRPELKQDVLTYAHGNLACQRRMESNDVKQGKEAEKAAEQTRKAG